MNEGFIAAKKKLGIISFDGSCIKYNLPRSFSWLWFSSVSVLFTIRNYVVQYPSRVHAFNSGLCIHSYRSFSCHCVFDLLVLDMAAFATCPRPLLGIHLQSLNTDYTLLGRLPLAVKEASNKYGEWLYPIRYSAVVFADTRHGYWSI